MFIRQKWVLGSIPNRIALVVTRVQSLNSAHGDNLTSTLDVLVVERTKHAKELGNFNVTTNNRLSHWAYTQ